MIEQIKEQKHIQSILKIKDDHIKKQLLEPRECSLTEWVQFLSSMVTAREDLIRVYGVLENDDLKYYMIAMNAVYPPISREMVIIYQNFYGAEDKETNSLLSSAIDLVNTWGKEVGAKRIHSFTHYPRVMTRFGFVVEKGSSIYREIK